MRCSTLLSARCLLFYSSTLVQPVPHLLRSITFFCSPFFCLLSPLPVHSVLSRSCFSLLSPAICDPSPLQSRAPNNSSSSLRLFFSCYLPTSPLPSPTRHTGSRSCGLSRFSYPLAPTSSLSFLSPPLLLSVHAALLLFVSFAVALLSFIFHSLNDLLAWDTRRLPRCSLCSRHGGAAAAAECSHRPTLSSISRRARVAWSCGHS